MLKYGRTERITFCVFIGHERHYALLGHLYIHYGSPSINFCCCESFAEVFAKGLFLSFVDDSNATDFKGGNSSCWFLICGYQALAELQCGIDLCMMDR